MAVDSAYPSLLSQALSARMDWLEKSELGKLKEELRVFQASFGVLYKTYIKKGLIHEDPYKQEAKIGEIEVPDTSAFTEAERVEQLTIRLANYDNQLDFLVNFYQFNVDFLALDRIKRILGLIKFIDWVHLSGDSPFPMTKAVFELNQQSKNGLDPLNQSLFVESLTKLSTATGAVIGYLKLLTDYHRESYKLNLRAALTNDMPEAEANQGGIKKKFAAAMPGKPFYPDLVDELLKEDYSKDGPALREKVLKSLQIPDTKPKVVKAPVSFKSILLEGLQVIGNSSGILTEIAGKIDENKSTLSSRKKGLCEKLQDLVRQILGREPEPLIYELQYTDPVRSTSVREKLNYHNFRVEIDKKSQFLVNFANRGNSKLESMPEEQLMQFLDRNIRDVQSIHKILGALDDFFKGSATKEEREKIKGIRPELAALKNSIVRSNQLRHEYSAQKEEEEQMKRLGISPGV
ncbi:MAG: hypothetical protein LBR93_03715 [Treponema sp.]|jgi:hypothetical protein|nr:hypothetical protein [Treponema sp.]